MSIVLILSKTEDNKDAANSVQYNSGSKTSQFIKKTQAGKNMRTRVAAIPVTKGSHIPQKQSMKRNMSYTEIIAKKPSTKTWIQTPLMQRDSELIDFNQQCVSPSSSSI